MNVSVAAAVLAEGIVVRPRTPLEPLKAQTINVAYQYGAQASKGSLEAGKLADLAILDGNPLTVAPMAI